jgi:Fe-S cluster assembly ATP-binding protein
MMKPSLTIKGLHVRIEDKEILKGVDLVIKGGEVHAIMGPNGTGKSTLASSVMGHPSYEVTAGSITLNGEDVLEMEVDERARKGLFLAMQSPREVSGVTNSDFMFAALNNYRQERGQEPISRIIFGRDYLKLAAGMKIDDQYAERYLNEGFSGGERKRNEILQMKVLQPSIAILDEIDSGLDVDALKIVGEAVSDMINDQLGVLLITHYERILEYIQPTHVHVMINGRVVKSGGRELIKKIDEQGYDWVKEELGIEIETKPSRSENPYMLGGAPKGK